MNGRTTGLLLAVLGVVLIAGCFGGGGDGTMSPGTAATGDAATPGGEPVESGQVDHYGIDVNWLATADRLTTYKIYQAPEGKAYLVVNVTVTNHGDRGAGADFPYVPTLETTDGATYAYQTDPEVRNFQFTENFRAYDNRTRELVFTIPEDATPKRLLFPPRDGSSEGTPASVALPDDVGTITYDGPNLAIEDGDAIRIFSQPEGDGELIYEVWVDVTNTGDLPGTVGNVTLTVDGHRGRCLLESSYSDGTTVQPGENETAERDCVWEPHRRQFAEGSYTGSVEILVDGEAVDTAEFEFTLPAR